MEQLAQILRDCHLQEDEVCGKATSTGSAQSQIPGITGTAMMAACPWADELVRQLQHCTSAEEGRALCAEALVAFHRHQAGACCSDPSRCPHLARLQKLQGANRVIVQALRVLSERQRAMQTRCKQAEAANAHLAEQLRQCQEQLQASERAKANLQSHLQLMNSNLGESTHQSHRQGPCN